LAEVCDKLPIKATEDTMTRYIAIVMVLLLPLAAMAQTAVIPDDCGASGFQGLVGQSHEIAEMLELEQPIRVIPSGAAVTTDYLPERINFDLDEAGTIVRITCG
jgi:hypothetical protein